MTRNSFRVKGRICLTHFQSQSLKGNRHRNANWEGLEAGAEHAKAMEKCGSFVPCTSWHAQPTSYIIQGGQPGGSHAQLRKCPAGLLTS